MTTGVKLPDNSNRNPHRNPHRLRGYRWNDQDPVLEEISTIIAKSGMPTTEISRRVNTVSHGAANVHKHTIDHWLDGTTRRPQNWTLTWVAFALGYERKWTKIPGGEKTP